MLLRPRVQPASHTAVFAVLALAVLGLGTAPANATPAAGSSYADFGGKQASTDVRRVADWVVGTRNNTGLPFIVVDKIGAALFLFDAGGMLRAQTAVLLGAARGDDSPPGIGDRKLSEITPAESITPAGRFVAERGENLAGRDILWIDYDAAVALHRVTDLKPGMATSRRIARLASAPTSDNRASLGCINVTAAFYDDFVRPAFGRTSGIVYILPETRSVTAEFRIPETDQPVQTAAAVQRARTID